MSSGITSGGSALSAIHTRQVFVVLIGSTPRARSGRRLVVRAGWGASLPDARCSSVPHLSPCSGPDAGCSSGGRQLLGRGQQQGGAGAYPQRVVDAVVRGQRPPLRRVAVLRLRDRGQRV